MIARALREVLPGHKYDRVLTAKMTVACVLVARPFPGALATTRCWRRRSGCPACGPGRARRSRPAARSPRPRKLLGEQVMQRLFELDAAVADADLGIGLLWKGLEVTAIDGTTMELARNDVLDGEFDTPADGARPLLRVTAHVRTATFRWIGAAIGGYHDGENALADQLEGSFRPGMLNLADRGFFSMETVGSAALRHRRPPGLARQGRREARDPRRRPSRTLPDGSELVMLHESDGMRTRRRRGTRGTRARNGSRTPPARLVTFTVTTATRGGRAKDHPVAWR